MKMNLMQFVKFYKIIFTSLLSSALLAYWIFVFVYKFYCFTGFPLQSSLRN